MAPDATLALRRARLAAQRVSTPAASVEEAVAAAGGLQAQDEPAARLAVRARTTGTTAGEVTRALEHGRLVRTWAMRGTLHLLPAADAAWLVPLLGPVFEAKARRRLDELGLDLGTLARGVDAVREILDREGPQPRADLIALLADRGLKLEGQARPHLLGHAARAGVIALAADEVVVPFRAEPMDRAAALRRLGAWYLQAFGPADRADFAAWSGLAAADVRVAFEGQDPPDPVEAEVPVVRLLGAYDNLLLGWRDGTFVLPAEVDDRVRHGGVLRAMLLVRGAAAGTWRLARGRVVLEPFEPLPPEVADAVEAEVADVARFLAG